MGKTARYVGDPYFKDKEFECNDYTNLWQAVELKVLGDQVGPDAGRLPNGRDARGTMLGHRCIQAPQCPKHALGP